VKKIAEPLPECRLCERPTRRTVHADNGGLCGECLTGIADTVKMLPIRPDVEPDDRTAYVERYRPPVPPRVEQQPACRWAHGPVRSVDHGGLCRLCAEDEE
jgi:hypothetical protein